MTYYGAKRLAESFRTVRKNLVQVAEDIPADKYGFRATPESMTVAESLGHLIVNTQGNLEIHAKRRIRTFVGMDFGAWAAERKQNEAKVAAKNKAEIVALLKSDGEAWAGYLDKVSEEELAEMVEFPAEFQTPPKSRFELILGIKEHEMHHRGQLMVVERLLGIVPHLTKQHQQAMAARQQKG